MRSKLVAAAFALLVPAVASADQPVQIYGGQPGPYEVHNYLHRSNSFDRQPYFATNPPVYYSENRLVRAYGWTPYPYLGSQYPIKKTLSRPADVEEGSAVVPTSKRKK